jgi:hypothetical protein
MTLVRKLFQKLSNTEGSRRAIATYGLNMRRSAKFFPRASKSTDTSSCVYRKPYPG